MVWMLFVCVNLFYKGRPIEGRVPPKALAVPVAAGQHSGQHLHCHQPGHAGHGLPHLFSRWPGLGQAAYTAQRGLGPGNVRASRTHQLNWPAAARTRVPLLAGTQWTHGGKSQSQAQLPGMSRVDNIGQSRESGWKSLTLPLCDSTFGRSFAAQMTRVFL